jgi:Transmembrane secretion effector
MPVIVKELNEEHLAGPVLVTIEYTVIEDQELKFLRAMRHYGRVWRRDGAYQWGIYRDIEVADRCFLSIRGLNIYANTSDRPRRIVFSKNVSTVTSPAIQKCDIFFMPIPQSHSAAVKAVKSGTQLTHRQDQKAPHNCDFRLRTR